MLTTSVKFLFCNHPNKTEIALIWYPTIGVVRSFFEMPVTAWNNWRYIFFFWNWAEHTLVYSKLNCWPYKIVCFNWLSLELELTFEMCIFSLLCLLQLRYHLAQVQKYQGVAVTIDLTSEETLDYHTKTRLLQLDTAIAMDLWLVRNSYRHRHYYCYIP